MKKLRIKVVQTFLAYINKILKNINTFALIKKKTEKVKELSPFHFKLELYLLNFWLSFPVFSLIAACAAASLAIGTL